MATSRVQVTEGSGKSLATHSFSEDAVTKEISRVNLNTSGGVETGVAATPLQVSLANTGANATPVVVDLGSNNDITGTVTANLSATDNAVLDAIEADTTTIAGAVAGTEMQVDIVSAPTLTVNAHAVTNAGTFVTQENGALLTAAQLIDDTVATLGTTTYTEATTKGNIIGAVRRDADTTLVDTTNEIGPLQMDANGRLKVEAFSGETLPVSLTSTTVTGTVAVTQSGTWDEVGINDSGNSITVDGTITADLGATDNAVLDAIAASTAAIETAVEGTLTVTGGGGGTEYTEDAAAAANPVGNALILVREDGRAGSLTTTDGDNVALRGNNKGEAYVKDTDLLTELQLKADLTETQPVSLASVPSHAVTNAGTFATQESGALLTSAQLIDDTVFVDDTATHSTGSTKVIGIGAVAVPTDSSVNANDIGMPAMTTDRKLHVAVMDALPAGTAAIGKLAANSGVDIGDVDITSIAAGDNNIGNVDIASIAAGDNNIGNVDVVTLPALAAGTNAIGKLLPPDVDVTTHTNYAKKYYTNGGAVTDGIVWSPASGKRFHIVSMYLQTSAAATITLEDDKAGGDEAIWKGEFAANQGMTINFSEKYPLASGEDAADLIVTTSAGNIYITITGYEI